MNYLESGFNNLMQRANYPSFSGAMTEDMSSLSIPYLDATSVAGGVSSSTDGLMEVNWNTGYAAFSDGAEQRVLLGFIEGENDYGIRIKDGSGNTVFSAGGQIQTSGIADEAVGDSQISGITAEKILAGDIIVAVDVGDVSTGYVRLDGTNDRIIVNDGTDNRIVIGNV